MNSNTISAIVIAVEFALRAVWFCMRHHVPGITRLGSGNDTKTKSG